MSNLLVIVVEITIISITVSSNGHSKSEEFRQVNRHLKSTESNPK